MIIGYRQPVDAALTTVEMIKHAPQTTHLDAGIAVDLGIKALVPAQCIDCNGIGFQRNIRFRKFVIDQKPQQLPHDRRACKIGIAQQSIALEAQLKLFLFGQDRTSLSVSVQPRSCLVLDCVPSGTPTEPLAPLTVAI